MAGDWRRRNAHRGRGRAGNLGENRNQNVEKETPVSAASKKTQAPKQIVGGVRPLPAPFWEHHRKTLEAPMSEWLERKTLPPVLLLTGRSGVGKRSLAYYIAQWAL